MDEKPDTHHIDTALVAIGKKLNVSSGDVDREILFQGAYTMSADDFVKANMAAARVGGSRFVLGFYGAGTMGFWPLVVALIAYTQTHNFNLAMFIFYVLFFGHLIINRMRWLRSVRKSFKSSPQITDQERNIYLTRSSFALQSDKTIYIESWRNYREVLRHRGFYILINSGGFKTVMPRSTFASDEEAYRFFALTKALIAKESIDHLI